MGTAAENQYKEYPKVPAQKERPLVPKRPQPEETGCGPIAQVRLT